jgi:hypothetical protein
MSRYSGIIAIRFVKNQKIGKENNLKGIAIYGLDIKSIHLTSNSFHLSTSTIIVPPI